MTTAGGPTRANESPVSRRAVVKYGGALAAFAAVPATAKPAFAGPAVGAEARDVLVIYDMQHLFSLDLTKPAEAAAAYDEMQLVATLQGIVNRDYPKLYVKFAYHDDFGAEDIDGFWLDFLQEHGNLLAGRPTREVASLDELIVTFRRYLRGAVVWDPTVPATSNVASTVSGVEDLVAIQYDPAEGSLYSRYVVSPPRRGCGGRRTHLPARVWLVEPDGRPRFTGKGTIAGTSLASTGSSKCDAYVWAKTRYLDSGRCDPGQLGYYLDSYWLTDPTRSGLLVAMVMNHDFLVSRRGFVFDLDPWADEEPVDDPGQPLGTDRSTLQAILLSAYRGTGGEMTAVHGFVPWQYKYSTPAPGRENHNPVGAEWETVRLVSAYNGYLDADAPGAVGGMANASVYRHTPLRRSYPQTPSPTVGELQRRGLVNADGSVVPKRYAMFYVGDYDSAAWIYHAVPRFWRDPNRGSVPLNWAFDPNLSERIAPAFLYTRAMKTPNDVFIAGDSGAGYLNPSMLETPRAYSGLPSGLGAWQRHCARYFRLWDISITGFVIDGLAPAMSAAGRATYAKFSTNGFAEQDGPTLGIVGKTPYLQGPLGSSVEQGFGGDTSVPPYSPDFHAFRTVLQSPTWHKELVDQVHKDLPNAEVTFVDALTFFALLRQYLEGQVVLTIGSAYVAVVPGQSVPISLDLTSYRTVTTHGTVALVVPSGWSVTPRALDFTLGPEASAEVSFNVRAPSELALGTRVGLEAVVTIGRHSRHYGFEARALAHPSGTATTCTILGATNVDHGLSQVEVPGDGRTSPVTIGGQSGREMVQVVGGDLNIYFDLDNSIASEGNFTATFTVDYYDQGDYVWQVQYDSTNTSAPVGGAYTTAGTVTNGNTKTWKTATFTVNDARFANRENGSTDLRIFSSTGPIIVHQVAVTVSGVGVESVQLCGAPPPITP